MVVAAAAAAVKGAAQLCSAWHKVHALCSGLSWLLCRLIDVKLWAVSVTLSASGRQGPSCCPMLMFAWLLDCRQLQAVGAAV
jgi:hypothetical protein